MQKMKHIVVFLKDEAGGDSIGIQYHGISNKLMV